MEETETRQADVASLPVETNRDRVRRLLLNPLAFRAPKGMAGDDLRRFLDGLADELGYMSDANLVVLSQFLQSKGQGAARNQWPDRATFLAYAEAAQPRPVTEMPALLRWFRSVEGPRALVNGTLVETYLYFEAKKAPPFTPSSQAMVRERARENAHRLQVTADRRRHGLSVSEEEVQFERWYADKLAQCTALVVAQPDQSGSEVA